MYKLNLTAVGRNIYGVVLGAMVALSMPSSAFAGEVRVDDEPEELTVTGETGRSLLLTASTSRVTAQDIASVPIRNAEDALRLVPGLTLAQHGSEGKGHQFFLRGFDAIHGADLELSVEGIPVNEWSNIHAQGYIDLGFIIPETIELVNVTKGPFFATQGAFAMAGSANYQLGIPTADRGLRAAYTAGTTNRHRGVLTYSPQDDDGRQFIAIEALHDDGFGQNRSIDRAALLTRVRLFDNLSYGSLSVLGSAYVADFALPGTLRNEEVQAGRVGFYGAHDSGGNGRSVRGLMGLAYEWFTAKQTVEANIYGSYRRLELLENYTGFLIDPINGDRRDQSQTAWSFGFKIGHSIALTSDLSFYSGLGLRGDVLDQAQQQVDLEEQPLETERDLQGVQLLSHGLVELRYSPLAYLQIIAGARLDLANIDIIDGVQDQEEVRGSVMVLSPRLALRWDIIPKLEAFAAYGRGFRPPEARSFTRFEPDRTGISDDLFEGGQPQMTVSDSFEVGARWGLNRYLSTSLSGFLTLIERESIFDHVSGVNLELNSTRRLGGELVVQLNPTDWLNISADLTAVDARFVASNNPVPLAPQLVAGARVRASYGGFQGGVRFMGLAPRPLPHNARGATLTVVDATAGYSWDRLRLDLEAENLLAQQVREGEYHYASQWRRGEPASEIPVIHYIAGPPFNLRMTVSAFF